MVSDNKNDEIIVEAKSSKENQKTTENLKQQQKQEAKENLRAEKAKAKSEKKLANEAKNKEARIAKDAKLEEKRLASEAKNKESKIAKDAKAEKAEKAKAKSEKKLANEAKNKEAKIAKDAKLEEKRLASEAKNKESKISKDAKAEKAKLKAEKAKLKAEKGKKLSSKDRERIRLLNTKITYKNSNVYALNLKNVKKSFGSKKVLRGVNFDIKKGEKLALIGKNGSGKSTLINVISQQLKMSEGEISYGYAKNRLESLELLGIQFQTLNYPEGFIVKDVIHFFNVSVDKSLRMSENELNDMISMFGIDKFMSQKIDRLSGGQQQRINILLALIKKPKLLILDEISTGLDVESAEVIKKYITLYLRKNPETSLLLISHSDEEIREMTTRTVVLEQGEIVENFDSNLLTNNRFLEITSREPKLSSEEFKKEELESTVLISKLVKAYNPKEKGRAGDFTSSISNYLGQKFQGINNENMKRSNALEIRNVSKTYGKTVGAVRNLTLDIKKGERVAITGPNGSGKTTLVEIIAQVKNMDPKYKEFINKKHLAKSDYQRNLANLDEDIKLQLRDLKNKYRLTRDLAEIEIADLIKEKNTNSRKMRVDSVKKQLSEKTQEARLNLKNDLDNMRSEIDEKIAKIKKDANRKITREKENYINLEKRLNSELAQKQEMAEKEYKAFIAKIDTQKQKYSENKYIYLNNSYLNNGRNVREKYITNENKKITYSFADTPRKVKDNTGVQFQYASFPTEMTVLDVILFFSRTNSEFMSKMEIVDAVRIFKLEKLLKQRAYRLSGGERQRLNVLLSIMKSPELLILDEISTGLDVDSIVKIDHFIQDYLNKTGATLILISHNYNEVHSLTDKIIVMKYGALSEIVDTRGWTLQQTKSKMRDIYRGGGI